VLAELLLPLCPLLSFQEAPAAAPELLERVLARGEDADPLDVRRVAELGTPAALEGLERYYDSLASLYMRRTTLAALTLFDGGAPELQARALRKITDIASSAREAELRDLAVDSLAAARGGRTWLVALVDSAAD